MRNYEERAKDFVKEIFPYIKECTEPWEAEDKVDEFNASFSRAVRVNHGIARIALITSDYVVKFNYDQYEVESVGGGEEEVEMYANAVRDGFDYLLAKITRYEYNGRTFYIMPRIRGVGTGHGYAQMYMTREERLWCQRWQLSDLHCNNYGFRNGHICLIDYACRSCYSDYDSEEAYS